MGAPPECIRAVAKGPPAWMSRRGCCISRGVAGSVVCERTFWRSRLAGVPGRRPGDPLPERMLDIIVELSQPAAMLRVVFWYVLAAAGEIAGCYAFYAWLRLGRSPLWIIPGLVSLAAFALALTRVEAAAAGRIFAAYGGIYILASLVWMGLVENQSPDRFDLAGAVLCLAGSAVILLAPR